MWVAGPHRGGVTDSQAAHANSIMTAGSAGQQFYSRRQCRPTALWPQANSIMATDSAENATILTKKLLKPAILTKNAKK